MPIRSSKWKTKSKEHVNQMNAMQNRLIAMERGQASRPQHRPNDKWPKKSPPQDQRPPNPFESTNWVDHQAIHYCRPCEQFHDESTCQVFLHLYDEMGPYGSSKMNKLICLVMSIMLACMIGWI
jgi:hypothetical protein